MQMTSEEIIFKVLEIIATSGIVTAIVALLGTSWIQNRFTQSLEEYKHKTNSLFNRITKIHEKEIEVLPEAWKYLLNAHGHLVHLLDPFGIDPEFSQMTEQQRIEFEEKFGAVWRAYQDFHNYFLYSSIFLGSDIQAEFQVADTLFENSFKKIRAAKSGLERSKFTLEVYVDLYENMRPIQERIKDLIQKRLRLTEA